jgi:hypothetical protein
VVRRISLLILLAVGAAVGAAALAGASVAESPPVGELPKGPTSTIRTQEGQLVAVALPQRAKGRVWRIARRYDARVVRQVSEADVGSSVVLVFRAVGTGATTISLGLTRGETSKAYESRRYVVRVR